MCTRVDVEAEHVRHFLAHEKGRLRRRPQRQFALRGIEARHGAVGFHAGRHRDAVRELVLEHVRCLRERAGHVAVVAGEANRNVASRRGQRALVNLGRIGAHCGVRREHGGQRLVVDDDQGQRVARQRQGIGGDGSDFLAVEAHLVHRQRIAIGVTRAQMHDSAARESPQR